MNEELLQFYSEKRDEIKKRLEEFKQIFQDSDERIFAEMAFCLCTPQSKATNCWNAIVSLTKNNLLLNGSTDEIRPFLNTVRFGSKKADYIVGARNIFTKNSKIEIKERLKSFHNSKQAREWLVENIRGFGMKEASHFLRNIGMGNDLAILDVHILKNLEKHKVIDEFPKGLTPKKYFEIEDKMKRFSQSVNIPFDELDLLFWSKETGVVFK